MKSSQIHSIGYDPGSKTLEVKFKNGAVHQYEGVMQDVNDSLMTADSKGHFFHSRIKNGYPNRQVA